MTSNHNSLIQVSKHIFLYRGFTIHRCPANSKTQRRAYQISTRGIYLGRDFSIDEAVETISGILGK